MRIEGLKKFRGRNPRGYFEDLPWEERNRANVWLHHFMHKGRAERGSVPPWLFALYVGQSKRLARKSPEERSAWGRSMRAKKGGLALQRINREQGRVGPLHPARLAAQSRAKRQAAIKEARLPGAPRHGFTDLTGI